MKFKARLVTEHEFFVEADNVVAAAEQAGEFVSNSPYKAKLLGVIPADRDWPDADEKPAPRPPRNTPPSGSPGTPVVRAA